MGLTDAEIKASSAENADLAQIISFQGRRLEYSCTTFLHCQGLGIPNFCRTNSFNFISPILFNSEVTWNATSEWDVYFWFDDVFCPDITLTVDQALNINNQSIN